MTRAALRKDAGPAGLLLMCLGAMVGSGWLFGPLHAARMAGPWSLAAWLIGAAVAALLALVYAELATRAPVSGAVVHFPRLSHGELLARIQGFINFLAYVIVGPIEAMAVLSYLNNLYPRLTDAHGALSAPGFTLALLLLALFTAVNLLSIRRVLAVNNALMVWKLAVPLATALLLPAYAWHPGNLLLPADHGALRGVLQATATAGVLFSFLGFRQAVELAGEARDPRRTLPRAILGSVAIGALLYLALQAAFLLALDPAMLAARGWHGLTFPGMAGPFAGLAGSLGATTLAAVLYVDAFISPGGTGLAYQTTATRVILAMSDSGQLPRACARLNAAGAPWLAGLVSFAAGAALLLPFPSWQKLVGAVSSIAVLAYSSGPIALLALRREDDGSARVFRLPAAQWLAPLAFFVSNLLIYWTGFKTLSVLFGAVAVVTACHLLHHVGVRRRPLRELHGAHCWWLLPWYAGLWTVAWLGDPLEGGRGVLSMPWDLLAIAALSLAVLRLALRCALPADQMAAKLRELDTPDA